MKNRKYVAIVLAAGSGKRMQSNTPKQYLLLGDMPVLYYSLKAFEESSIDEIILVVGKNEIDYCRKSIVEKYDFKKITKIIEGGEQRYHSVYNALLSIKSADYVLIHDGARPFVSNEMIEKTILDVMQYKACVVGIPSKDTIKIVDDQGVIVETPNRDNVWSIQTPQAFSFEIIRKAYSQIINNIQLNITDDAMIVEHTLQYPIKMVIGSYRNIKITTPEDILIGEVFLQSMNEKETISL